MESKKYQAGSIISADLTIPNAEAIKDFYKAVIGWETEALTMGDEQGEYNDYVMKDAAGNWVGGICHKRGVNVDQPPGWIVYVNVADIEKSIEKCRALGGKVMKESRMADGTLQFVLIEDPAGAVLALTKEA
jgi:Predicted enzyme related to lactoylglutathione lyase